MRSLSVITSPIENRAVSHNRRLSLSRRKMRGHSKTQAQTTSHTRPINRRTQNPQRRISPLPRQGAGPRASHPSHIVGTSLRGHRPRQSLKKRVISSQIIGQLSYFVNKRRRISLAPAQRPGRYRISAWSSPQTHLNAARIHGGQGTNRLRHH